MSILGRKKKSRPQADRQPAERPSRPPRQPTLDSPQTTLDPMKVWRAFKPKTLLYARLWLETGELPVSCHFVIRERLEPWIAAVIAGGPELRDALVAAVPPIPPRAPVPTRGWVMPTSHRLEGSRRSTDDPSQIRPAEILAFPGVDLPKTPPPDVVVKTPTLQPICEGEVSKSATLVSEGSNAAEILDLAEEEAAAPVFVEVCGRPVEVLSDPATIRKLRGGGPSVFEAEFWGEAPTNLPRFPKRPAAPMPDARWDRWGRELIAAIKARTAPPLLRLDEALAAIDFKRKPRWLPAARQDGEMWVEREIVRAHLLFGLPQVESTAVLAAWPIKVPRCRYCGRLSIYGWADMICDRCEKIRSQIETAQMSRFSIAARRGWTGPPTIGDDELLLAVQKRLSAADHSRVKEKAKAEKDALREKRREAWATAGEAADPANDDAGLDEAAE